MMGRRIVLHVGLQKTGSTAIQQFLFRNRKRLAEQRLLYPGDQHPGGRPDHQRIARLLREGHPDIASDPYVAEIFARCRAWDGDIILSSEGFSTSRLDNVAPLRALLTEIERPADRFRILFYCRRQDRYLESAYKQHVRQPNVRTQRGFETFRQDMQTRRGLKLDYARQLAIWSEHFGPEAIAVHPFEKAQMPDGIFIDCLTELGLAWDDAYRPPPRDATNISLSATGTELLRQINADALPIAVHQAVVAALAQRDTRNKRSEPALMAPEVRRQIIERYAESNRRVARDLLGRDDGRLFLEPVENTPALTPAEAEALAEEIPQVLERAHAMLAATRVAAGAVSEKP